MKQLSPEFRAYTWAPPNDEVARLAGIDPSQVVRYDQNTPPLPLPSTRPGTIAGALAGISGYPPGGYLELRRAIADYNGVDPDQIVLGTGADDLILLCARCFAGPGRPRSRSPRRRPTRSTGIAAQLAGAEVGDDDPVLTFTCRPNSPDGELRPLPEARPLVVRRGVLRVLRRDGDPAARRRGDRAADVLEGVRARRRAHRLCARRAATSRPS